MQVLFENVHLTSLFLIYQFTNKLRWQPQGQSLFIIIEAKSGNKTKPPASFQQGGDNSQDLHVSHTRLSPAQAFVHTQKHVFFLLKCLQHSCWLQQKLQTLLWSAVKSSREQWLVTKDRTVMSVKDKKVFCAYVPVYII